MVVVTHRKRLFLKFYMSQSCLEFYSSTSCTLIACFFFCFRSYDDFSQLNSTSFFFFRRQRSFFLTIDCKLLIIALVRKIFKKVSSAAIEAHKCTMLCLATALFSAGTQKDREVSGWQVNLKKGEDTTTSVLQEPRNSSSRPLQHPQTFTKPNSPL